jgi:hypothetical protein
MEEINGKAKLNKQINLSQMVERFLFNEFKPKSNGKKSVSELRGILKVNDEMNNWKQDKINRLAKKYLK